VGNYRRKAGDGELTKLDLRQKEVNTVVIPPLANREPGLRLGGRGWERSREEGVKTGKKKGKGEY